MLLGNSPSSAPSIASSVLRQSACGAPLKSCASSGEPTCCRTVLADLPENVFGAGVAAGLHTARLRAVRNGGWNRKDPAQQIAGLGRFSSAAIPSEVLRIATEGGSNALRLARAYRVIKVNRTRDTWVGAERDRRHGSTLNQFNGPACLVRFGATGVDDVDLARGDGNNFTVRSISKSPVARCTVTLLDCELTSHINFDLAVPAIDGVTFTVSGSDAHSVAQSASRVFPNVDEGAQWLLKLLDVPAQ